MSVTNNILAINNPLQCTKFARYNSVRERTADYQQLRCRWAQADNTVLHADRYGDRNAGKHSRELYHG